MTAALLAEPTPLADRSAKHREDLLDAVLCAWTGLLWLRHGLDRCQVLGDHDGDPPATILAPAPATSTSTASRTGRRVRSRPLRLGQHGGVAVLPHALRIRLPARPVWTSAFDRFVLSQSLAGAADALVAVSLAGSLFFSLSPEASRQQVLLYLVINMVPFALLAPLVGPAVDHFRLGYRWINVLLGALRALCALALAFSLLDLALYFFALALLVVGQGVGRRRPGDRSRARRGTRPTCRRQLPTGADERHRRGIGGLIGGAVLWRRRPPR